MAPGIFLCRYLPATLRTAIPHLPPKDSKALRVPELISRCLGASHPGA